MKRTVISGIVLIILGVAANYAWGFTASFQDLLGPVWRVEKWSYVVEMKFGEPVEEESAHSLTTYDRQGNAVEEIHYRLSGGVDERYERTFDETDRLTSSDKYDRFGLLESRTLYTYTGNIQTSRGYDKTGKLVSASESELDEDGRFTRRVAYNVETGDVSTVVVLAYAPNGEPSLSEMYDRDGELGMRMEVRYDIDGKDAVTELVAYVLGTELKSFTGAVVLSQKDAYGNWTEKLHYSYEEQFGVIEWVLDRVTRREIEYYQ